MKKNLLILFLAVICCSAPALAQIKTVTGKVVSADDGMPLPGASVIIKGTGKGTVTNTQGIYIVSASAGQTLVFTFIGTLTQEIIVGASNTINVTMKANSQTLNEVVYTAFNIKEDRKAINYAVQNVSSKDIEESRQQNIVNALQGKIAGAIITSSGGGPGEGASIVLRGGSSLDGDNQPLFVVDGVPLDNTSFAEPTTQGTGSGFNGVMGRSVGTPNRASDINPEDIETLTVLKGPAAAALYGTRGGNGAIIITTKKGKSGAASISYSNLFSFDNVMKLPETQSIYKQGVSGVYNTTTRLSYGSQFLPGETIYNNLENFFQTGTSMQHNFSVSGGSDKATYRFSAVNSNQNGVVPKTEYGKTSLKISGNLVGNDRFSANGSANYLHTYGRRPLQGPGLFGGTGGFLVSIFNWPKNDNMADYLSPDGTRRRLLASVTADTDNPYWTIDNNPQTDVTDRFVANASLEFKAFKWLKFNYTIGTDYYTERDKSVRAVGTSQPSMVNGGIAETVNTFQNITSNFLASIDKKFGAFSTNLLLGNNVEQRTFNTLDDIGTTFLNPTFISINNTATRNLVQRNSIYRIYAFFGSLNIDYKKTVFLNATGRNDFSSTLPEKNQSYFYPSVSLGYEFTKTLGLDDNKFFNYGKLKVSYASVGKDTQPYRLVTPLTGNTFIGAGYREGFFGNNPELRSERRNSFETGLDLQFLKNRLRLDVTYYRDRTVDQIIAPRVSQATGYILQYVNGGVIQNQGVELMLSGTVIQKKDFNWDVNFNFARNKSLVVSLPFPLTVLRNSDAAIINTAEGGSYPGTSLTGVNAIDYQRDPNGNILIDANGYPLFNTLFSYAGDRAPDFTLGLNNTFRYKGLELSFLLDIRKGGKVINGNEWELVRSGLSMQTADRYKTVIFDGVVKNADGTYSKNTKPAELTESYFRNNLALVGTPFVEDGSWIRLRSINLNYSLDKRYTPKPFTNLSVFATARNLFVITKYTGIDPEVGVSGAGVRGSGSMGLDYGGVPARKGFDFGIKLGF